MAMPEIEKLPYRAKTILEHIPFSSAKAMALLEAEDHDVSILENTENTDLALSRT